MSSPSASMLLSSAVSVKVTSWYWSTYCTTAFASSRLIPDTSVPPMEICSGITALSCVVSSVFSSAATCCTGKARPIPHTIPNAATNILILFFIITSHHYYLYSIGSEFILYYLAPAFQYSKRRISLTWSGSFSIFLKKTGKKHRSKHTSDDHQNDHSRCDPSFFWLLIVCHFKHLA